MVQPHIDVERCVQIILEATKFFFEKFMKQGLAPKAS